MKLLAIDGGTNESACLLMQDDTEVVMGIEWFSILPNIEVLDIIRNNPALVVIEDVTHMGMPVGRDVFETVRWTGRFEQTALDKEGKVIYIPRTHVKLNVCGTARAKDPHVRQALIDRYGGDSVAIGGKKCTTCKGKTWIGRNHDKCVECNATGWKQKKGALYGVSSHVWSALAVAVTYIDQSRAPS